MRNKRIKNPRNLRNPDNSGFLPAIRTRIVLFILHLLSYYFRYCSADSFPVKVLCHRKNSPSVHFYYHAEVYKLPYERAAARRDERGGAAGAAGQLGARKPAGPCSSVSFAPSPPRFFARGRRRLGARNPAGPCFSVPFAPSLAHFFTRGRAGVVPHRSLSLVPSSWGTTSSSTAVIPAGRAWCLTAR